MTDVRRSADRVTLAGVFVELASTLVGPYEVSDLAQRLVDRAVDLLDVWAAGLLLLDPGSTPKMLAASTHQAELLELIQVRSGQGPCLAAMERNDVVVVEDLAAVEQRWPQWVAGARAIGVQQAYGIPLRLQGQTVGALNLFRTGTDSLAAEDVAVARAMADVATVGIIQHQVLDRAESLTTQLQGALHSRVVLEQAKGRLAERQGITVAEAFVELRRRARETSTPLSVVAKALVEEP
ncbi:GAF and ANTAR domain-containing protein [Actinotalea sp. C106]|uniref:GAF and ANTAR domain-containing protein n=1 Tax=Actinotalea sp. C106 TaxID=2908644 RepID=UPI002028E469|nr:GAF and ANTAR domain-containing protein [Actinotalea sp. C106]